jgi:phosphoglucomutase
MTETANTVSARITEALLKVDEQKQLSADSKLRIRNWFTDPQIADSDKDAIVQLVEANNWTEIQDRFFQDLEFGTGGLRGIVGQGSNRMNTYIIQRVTQGLASYVTKNFPPNLQSAAIAYDSRLYSRQFAETAAAILAANGIKVFLFETYETTPCLSFAVRQLQCATGICLTASHNPPEYAGYKVYAEDGAQIVAPADRLILTEVANVEKLANVRSCPFESALQTGQIEPVPKSVIEQYDQAVLKLQTFSGRQRKIKVAYTPLHGTGAAPARRIMNQWGFHQFHIVPSQEQPDSNFPTVSKPNPEEPDALKLLLQEAERCGAEAGFATDPDSDRLALVSKEDPQLRAVFTNQSQGNYILLNGNQTGALILDFLLTQWTRLNRLPKFPAVVKTIVTSEMHRRICTHHNVSIHDTLTGFKWIAALVRTWETSQAQHNYVFGTEESFGYMPGTYVRDKDGIAALAICAEMCDHLYSNGSSPAKRLLELFSEFDAWHESLYTIELGGHSGKARIKAIMESFRNKNSVPSVFAGTPVRTVEDYQTGLVLENLGSNYSAADQKITLPKSDVLVFRLADGGQISVRPSGTEPKIKFYYSACTKVTDSPEQAYLESVRKTEAYHEEITNLCNSSAGSQ